jgi:hypothetical protein
MKLVRAVIAGLAGRERRIAYLIALLTIALGLVMAIRTGDKVQSLDEPDFLDLAVNVARTGHFAQTPRANDARHASGGPAGQPYLTAYRAPGYPLLLAPVAALGGRYVGMRFFNFLIVAAGLIALFHVIAETYTPMAGLLAVAGVVGYPVVLYTATTLYPQTLASVLLVITVWMTMTGQRLDRLRYFLLAGLSSGAMILTVPTLLLPLPLLAVWLLATSRVPRLRRVTYLLLFSAATAGAVGIWTVRNAIAFSRFIPIATSAGFNLAAGNCDEARYDTSLDVHFPEDVYRDLTGKDEVESNQIFTRAAVSWIKAHPRRAAVLFVEKFAHWFDYSNKLMSDSVIKTGASAVSAGKREVLLLAAYGGILLLVAIRLSRLRRQPLTPFEILVGLLYVGTGLAYAIFFTRVRFRLPVDWLLIGADAGFVSSILTSVTAQGAPGSPLASWPTGARPSGPGVPGPAPP